MRDVDMTEHIILYSTEFDGDFDYGLDYSYPFQELCHQGEISIRQIISDILLENDFLPIPNPKDIADWLTECRESALKNQPQPCLFLATLTDPKTDDFDPLNRTYSLVYERYQEVEYSKADMLPEPKPQQLTLFE